MLEVTEKEDLMISCKSGVTIRMKVAQISEQGRATQGVKLIRVDDGDEIAAITRLDESRIEEEEVAELTADATDTTIESSEENTNQSTDNNESESSDNQDTKQ